MKHSKRYTGLAEKVQAGGPYEFDEAIELLKASAGAKFDETAEVVFRLGVDPRHADQQIRGTIVMPHGTGQSVKILVLTKGEKVAEAEEAGADFVGAEDYIEKIKGGWLEADTVIATPDMMKDVGRLGKVLGPRGLMPNPKSGTVSTDVAAAVTDIKAGKVEFRVDKTAIIHAPLGKVSFSHENLVENARSLIDAVQKAKPATAKGRYLHTVYLCSTMGPGVQVDLVSLEAK